MGIPIFEDIRGLTDVDQMIDILNSAHKSNMDSLRSVYEKASFYDSPTLLSGIDDYFNEYYNYFLYKGMQIQLYNWNITTSDDIQDDE